MSPKDNFAQTMKELLGGSGKNEKADSAEDKKPLGVPLSSFGQAAGRDEKRQVQVVAREGEEASDEAKKLDETKEDAKTKPATEQEGKNMPPVAAANREEQKIEPAAIVGNTSKVEGIEKPVHNNNHLNEPTVQAVPLQQGAVIRRAEREANAYVTPAFTTPAVDGVTVIAFGTKIVGDIDTEGGIRVNGSVKGNIRVGTTLELNGKVIGDIEAEDICVRTSVIKGNVSARNMVDVDKETTVVGDVSARNAEIDGKIKGNLTVAERAHIMVDSILMGNLLSGTVNIEEGAMLKGDISITNPMSDNVDILEPDFDIDIRF